MELRKMESSDLPQFEIWLSKPHVKLWYHEPQDWIMEIEDQDKTFSFIHHYMVICNNKPIGFCQYYACENSDEKWDVDSDKAYSIDYMIGEENYLKKGHGKRIILELINMIKKHKDAKRIIVKPEKENVSSCKALLSCGFICEKDTYILEL